MKKTLDSKPPHGEPLNALQKELIRVLAEKAVEDFLAEEEFPFNTKEASHATH